MLVLVGLVGLSGFGSGLGGGRAPLLPEGTRRRLRLPNTLRACRWMASMVDSALEHWDESLALVTTACLALDSGRRLTLFAQPHGDEDRGFEGRRLGQPFNT